MRFLVPNAVGLAGLLGIGDWLVQVSAKEASVSERQEGSMRGGEAGVCQGLVVGLVLVLGELMLGVWIIA